MIFCHLQIFFFKVIFFQQFFSGIPSESVKQFGSRSGSIVFRPDLYPYCLQRLSADDTISKDLIIT